MLRDLVSAYRAGAATDISFRPRPPGPETDSPCHLLDYRANIFARNFILSTKSTFVAGQLGGLWNEVDSSRRSLRYTVLSAGDYVLRFLGSHGRGDWNDEGARLAISMLPPWWASWWFRAFVAALVLLAGWTFLQLRLRQQVHEFNLRLEERLEERTRIARELHDTLLQSFQGLVCQFQAA
jgi:signal transduction histidine kinase